MAEDFKIDGENYDFKIEDEILYYCPKQPCLAKNHLKKFNPNQHKKLKPETHASSLGSLYCRQVLKGASTLGVNRSNDGRAFCVLSDMSFIEINSLTRQLNSTGDL